MPHPIERETRKTVELGGERTEVRHPSFATIGASRVQGGSPTLFASRVDHHGHVRVSIQPAKLYEDGYSETVMGDTRPLIEVMMSEAQWVAFISRMNIGTGTPCTLLYAATGPTEAVPQLPEPEKHIDRMGRFVDSMSDEHRELVAKNIDRLKSIAESLPKGKQKEVEGIIEALTKTLNSNLAFSKKMLTEHTEKAIVQAKTEIDAFTKGVVTQLGLNSLQDAVKLLALTSQKDEDTSPTDQGES